MNYLKELIGKIFNVVLIFCRIYKTTSRTLCSDPPVSGLYNPLEYEYYDDVTTVQVTVSTRSRLQISFTMTIAWRNNTIRR